MSTLLDEDTVVLEDLDFATPCDGGAEEEGCQTPAEVALICRGCNRTVALLCIEHLHALRMLVLMLSDGVQCVHCQRTGPTLDSICRAEPLS